MLRKLPYVECDFKADRMVLTNFNSGVSVFYIVHVMGRRTFSCTSTQCMIFYAYCRYGTVLMVAANSEFTRRTADTLFRPAVIAKYISWKAVAFRSL